MAAQNQKIEYLFAAQVTGQGELQKLTMAVDSLRKEMDALKAASGGVGAATQQYTRSIGNASSHVQAYQKHLDAQSKALRNSRIGTMQAGMQVNDFVTSVSTGASPIQAFNQQIGQVGYAMSMMGGKMGAVGSFLAGPWSILIIGASMAVGYLIEKFDLLGTESNKAKSAITSLSDSFDLATASATDLEAIDRLLAEANKQVAATSIQAANATAAKAAADANGAEQAIKNAKAILAKERAELTALKRIAAAQDKLSSNVGKDRIFARMGAGAIIGVQAGEVEGLEKGLAAMERRLDGFAMVSRRASAESYSLSSAMDVSARATEKHQQTINNLTNSYASGKITQDQFRKGIDLETSSYKKLQDSMKRVGGEKRVGKSDAEKAQEKQQKEDAKNLEDFFGIIEKANVRELPEYARQVLAVEEAFQKLNATQQATSKVKFAKIFEQLRLDDKGAQKEVSDYLKEPLKELAVSPEMTDIISRADELNKSFEEIGNTVSEAFKGMLTGAMSWKDGMRSLIGSVIDQLWKLFVVQKIVGLISGALGGTSTPVKGIGSGTTAALVGIPANAYGGSVMGNKPTLVGERGPELFVPGGNGTIIPNSNMRGGGGGGSPISISVDARGASDPAAVRAQVQQGILEAAPAIIAAAESRTMANMRRPRLGGGMQ